MPELLLRKAKYANWENSHTFENCKLNRKEYGEFLSSYITGEQNGFVLNINGAWGSGKTEFLKRIYTDLLIKKHPCIYIDAWESDFSKNPLTVVTSELLNQLRSFNTDIYKVEELQHLSKLFTKVLKGAAIGVAGGLTKYLIGDGTVGTSAMQEWVNDDSPDYLEFLTKEYAKQIEAIQLIKENLTCLALVLETNYSIKLPIVVLVDELDRCRPTYAIEMLEIIKHFFKTDKFVFIIATDTDQLSHSIKAVYGQDFDSKQYLKRFFDRKATLPTPDIEAYLNAQSIDYEPYNKLKLFPKMNYSTISQSINQTISLLTIAYNLHIRDIDQLMNKFQSCLRSALTTFANTTKTQYINFPALLIGLIEHDRSQEVYDQRTKFHSPEPDIKNPNHKISEDFLLIDFIKQSMLNITFFENYTVDRFRRNLKVTELRSPNELRVEIEHDSTDEFRKFVNESATNIGYGAKDIEDQCKYWNWDDMKKVIELAGTIE